MRISELSTKNNSKIVLENLQRVFYMTGKVLGQWFRLESLMLEGRGSSGRTWLCQCSGRQLTLNIALAQ